jgi:hypothetical protein
LPATSWRRGRLGCPRPQLAAATNPTNAQTRKLRLHRVLGELNFSRDELGRKEGMALGGRNLLAQPPESLRPLILTRQVSSNEE